MQSEKFPLFGPPFYGHEFFFEISEFGENNEFGFPVGLNLVRRISSLDLVILVASGSIEKLQSIMADLLMHHVAKAHGIIKNETDRELEQHFDNLIKIEHLEIERIRSLNLERDKLVRERRDLESARDLSLVVEKLRLRNREIEPRIRGECSCEGSNPKCFKCGGRGWID
jgi:hypothetical protein